ncbi:MAG: PAS domain S-box protein [Gammaproteobacteria bacterium]|jgi:PAS domain S-box-containing protein|nr:PAS domain S-box protein [Gammaproteobacteria bacterium]
MVDPRSGFDAAAVIEAAAESILITTADLDAPGPSIVYVNPAFERMTGWSGDEVIGKSPRLLQGPKTDLQIFNNLRETLRRGELWEGQTINYRKDGTEFWMEWSIVPIVDEHADVCQYVAVQRNVTARVEASRRLGEARAAELAADKARANLARYFSPAIVETLASKDQPLGPARRDNLAIMFTDIVGFTRLSEMLEPEVVIEMLRDVHSWMEKIIFKWDGSIEGYIGDAVMAIFGFPDAGRRDSSNALACAYELLTAAQQHSLAKAEQGLPPVQIRLGLQYGPVALGDVGTQDYVEFTVIGDTVNIASRLQEASRALDCHLVVGQELVNSIRDEGAREDIGNLLERLEYHGNFDIRGRSKTVKIWTYSDASL